MLTNQTPIAFSGNIPVYYDSYLGPMFFEPYAHEMAKRINAINPEKLLELASGTGRLTKLLTDRAMNGKTIIASDINPAMVDYGKSKTYCEGIKWMEIDAVNLPFEDNSFDAIAVQFGVMFYSDRVKAYKEAMRVLKTGGKLVFSSWDKIENNPMAQLVSNTLTHFFPIDTPAFYTVPFSYFNEKLITEELMEAGFNNINIETVKQTGNSKTSEGAAAGLINGTPTVTAIEDRSPEIMPLILEYLEGQISEQFGKTQLHVPLQAKIVIAQK